MLGPDYRTALNDMITCDEGSLAIGASAREIADYRDEIHRRAQRRGGTSESPPRAARFAADELAVRRQI